MRAVKIVLELLLTLAVMRSISWTLGWLLSRVWRTETWRGALIANVVALAVFTAFLVWNLVPGEPFDREAFAFGLVVYLLFFLADLKWRPWNRAKPG
jgi:hypothetical protein